MPLSCLVSIRNPWTNLTIISRPSFCLCLAIRQPKTPSARQQVRVLPTPSHHGTGGVPSFLPRHLSPIPYLFSCLCCWLSWVMLFPLLLWSPIHLCHPLLSSLWSPPCHHCCLPPLVVAVPPGCCHPPLLLSCHWGPPLVVVMVPPLSLSSQFPPHCCCPPPLAVVVPPGHCCPPLSLLSPCHRPRPILIIPPSLSFLCLHCTGPVMFSFWSRPIITIISGGPGLSLWHHVAVVVAPNCCCCCPIIGPIWWWWCSLLLLITRILGMLLDLVLPPSRKLPQFYRPERTRGRMNKRIAWHRTTLRSLY